MNFEQAAKQMTAAVRSHREANLRSLALLANTTPERVEEILAEMDQAQPNPRYSRRTSAAVRALGEAGKRFGKGLMAELNF